ncbi:MAG: hypothetical protein ABUT11_01075 [Leifsonia sp.]
MGTHEIGIGDQVIITHDSRDGTRDWVGEPSGEVVAAADDHSWDAVVGEMSADFPWVVALDTPQYLKDGTGPFTEATVEGWRLELAPVDDDGPVPTGVADSTDTAASR